MNNIINIPPKAEITETFKCPTFAFNDASLSYKACIGRQVTKTPYGKPMYPECIGCKDGKIIKKHFKNYKHDINNKTRDCTYKKKKAKKGTSPYSPHYTGNSQVSVGKPTEKAKGDNIGMIAGRISEPEINCENCQLKTLVNAQINLVIDYLNDKDLDEALRRLGMILDKM